MPIERIGAVSGYNSHKEIDFGAKLALPALLADFRVIVYIPTHSPLHVTHIQLGVGVSLVVLEELVFRNDSGAIIVRGQIYEEISIIKKESAKKLR